jgi:hypothetical protein
MGQSLLQSLAYLSHIGVFQVLKWQFLRLDVVVELVFVSSFKNQCIQFREI